VVSQKNYLGRAFLCFKNSVIRERIFLHAVLTDTLIPVFGTNTLSVSLETGTIPSPRHDDAYVDTDTIFPTRQFPGETVVTLFHSFFQYNNKNDTHNNCRTLHVDLY